MLKSSPVLGKYISRYKSALCEKFYTALFSIGPSRPALVLLRGLQLNGQQFLVKLGFPKISQPVLCDLVGWRWALDSRSKEDVYSFFPVLLSFLLLWWTSLIKINLGEEGSGLQSITTDRSQWQLATSHSWSKTERCLVHSFLYFYLVQSPKPRNRVLSWGLLILFQVIRTISYRLTIRSTWPRQPLRLSF